MEEGVEWTPFRIFTRESLFNIERRIAEEQAAKEAEKTAKESESESEDDGDETTHDHEPKPNPKLEAGRKLPPSLEDVPPAYIARPLEDLDEFYHNKKTFVVLSKDKSIFRFSATNAMFILTPFNPIRRGAIYILVHPLFSLFIMLTIISNCVFMTITSITTPIWLELFSVLIIVTIVVNCVFMARTDPTPEYLENLFLGIYTLEAFTKILARGVLLEPFTCLRDPWNWLDFFVISVAYLTMVISTLGNLTALRTFRVLRALKTVAVIPGLKTIVGALLEAVRRLRDVMILTVFVLSIFALVGMQLYSGSLRQKCIRNYTEEIGPNVTDDEWYAFASNTDNWEKDFYGSYLVCGNVSLAGRCGSGYVCLRIGDNPNFGYTNFDNFGWALLCAFRLMTQDFWESLYHLVLRAEGSAHSLYFLFVILLGSFYLVNLILAIVAMSYGDQQKQDAADAEEEKAERQQEDAKKELSLATKSPSDTSWNQEDEMCGSPDQPADKERMSVTSEQSAASQRVLKLSGTQKRASLSLPGSPYTHQRNGSKGSQFSWKKGKHIHSNDRQPLVHQNIEALPLPFADDSAAVTPSSEDLCSSPFFLKNLPNGRRFSFAALTGYRHPLATNRPSSRRSSFGSQHSRASRTSRRSAHSQLGGGAEKSKMQTLLNFSKNKSKVPDVVLDTSKLADNVSISSTGSQVPEKQKKSGSNPFLNSSPTGANVEIKDVMVLKDIFEQATEHRQSLMSVLSETPMTMKDKLWRYCCLWDCSPTFTKIQEYVNLFIMDAFVDLFITLCILVNTLFMALDRHNMNKELESVSSSANLFFTGIFAIEAFLKIIALSPSRYFKEGWNVFDSVIVFLSLTELVLTALPGLSVLRAFRLLRVFKLAKSWPTLNMLISIVARTISAIGNLVIVLGIVVFIFAVMGQQLFGSEYVKFKNTTLFPELDGEMPRWNFSDFLHSFMIVFRVLCGEWIESMWDCIRVAGWPCIPFFLLTMIVGNLVVLNLFLALLLSSFGAENLQVDNDDEPNKLAEAIDRFRRFGSWVKVKIIVCLKVRLRGVKAKQPPLPLQVSPELNGKEALVDGMTGTGLAHVVCVEKTPEDLPDGGKMSRTSSISSRKKPLKSPTGSEVSSSSSSLSSAQGTGKVVAEGEPEMNEVEVVYVKEPDDCLCKICMKRPCVESMSQTKVGRGWWSIRCFMFRVTEHKYFETFIIVMILFSSLALAFEDVYLNERPILKEILEYLDKVFTYIFIGEMIIKWFAFGFKIYFTDAWCWLDFMIVGLSIFMMIMESLGGTGNSAIRALRTLRALRPLRAVSRWEGMRVVVNALIKAIPSICNVLLVCLVFWLIFGIMGVQLFKGKFYSCKDANDTRLPVSVVTNSTQCAELGYNWTNSKITFDDVVQAYLALFQVATYKGWIDIMNNAIDAKEIGEQPDREVNIYSYLYFVLFIIFGSFFTLNLFIGVIIENFNAQKKKAGGSLELFMTEDQKKYYNAMKRMKNKSPQKSIPRPKIKLAAIIFDITTNQKFDIVIMLIIMANMLTMTMEYYGMPNLMKNVLQYINILFIAIFTLECVLKLIGLRLYYFKVPWNVFDFIVVVLSILASSLSEFEDSFFISPTLLRVIRVFRVGRVLRLVKSAKGIRTLLFSLAVSLPALFNIGLLLALVMFIYSIMGMNFFREAPKVAGLDDAFNFDTFFRSMILLFQMCTSAGWADVMNALIYNCPTEGSCKEYNIGTLYLASYLIISYLVVVNMYIAVILENFSQATEDVQQGLTPDDFDMYYEKWEKYDPKATKYIPLDQLSDFVDFLDEPLRLPKPNHFLLVKMEIPICEGDRCYCKDILDALTKNFLGTTDTSMVPVKEEHVDENYMAISTTLKRQKEHYAARIIQKAYRNYKKRKEESDGEGDDAVDGGAGSRSGGDDGGGRGCARRDDGSRDAGSGSEGEGGEEEDREREGSGVSRGSGSGGTSSTLHPDDARSQLMVCDEDDIDPKAVELKADSGVVA